MNPTPSTRALPLLALTLLVTGCGAAVTPAAPPAVADAGSVAVDAPVAADAPVAPSPEPPAVSCDVVRAGCGPAPQQFVRGHAAGLTGLDGARVRFAMRYVRVAGQGLNVAHGVVVAGAEVRGGAFEACVCMPQGSSAYPQIATVIFAPGSTGDTSRDVARAMYSQRYATLGDEDVTFGLNEVPSAPEVEAALAGLVDRAHTVRLRGLDVAAEGGQAYAGLIADERPIAAQVIGGRVTGGALALDWIMPGRAWPTERVALVIDRNSNRRCDDGDLGAMVRLDGRVDVEGIGSAWSQGADLTGICRALSLESDRER